MTTHSPRPGPDMILIFARRVTAEGLARLNDQFDSVGMSALVLEDCETALQRQPDGHYKLVHGAHLEQKPEPGPNPTLGLDLTGYSFSAETKPPHD